MRITRYAYSHTHRHTHTQTSSATRTTSDQHRNATNIGQQMRMQKLEEEHAVGVMSIFEIVLQKLSYVS